MLKNLIIIENGNSYQFETERELVKKLICDDYYELSENKKIEAIKIYVKIHKKEYKNLLKLTY